MKICPLGTNCSMWVDGQTDRQTDMTKLIVGFHNYANGPKMNMNVCTYTNTRYYYCCDHHAHNA